MSLKIDDMSSQNQSYILGAIEMQGPTASEKRCSIFIDLAELFDAEYTSDAVKILKSKWKELGKKGKLDIDGESDCVSVLTSKGWHMENNWKCRNHIATRCGPCGVRGAIGTGMVWKY
jgi:hypothetical protein